MAAGISFWMSLASTSSSAGRPIPTSLERSSTSRSWLVWLWKTRDRKWVGYDAWNPDFAGLGVAQAVEQQGDRRAIIAHFWGIVEGTSTFLGIEKCWANLRRNPDLMRAWFDRFADWLCGLSDSCIDAGADIMQMSDDWGSNQTMLFRPEMWRDLIKPYASRVISHIRSRGVPVSLHSDGYIMPILDDLVDMGVAMLHPVQESAGMDPQAVKAGYGDKLVVYGSLDTVDALLLQEDEALAEYITGRFANYAPGGDSSSIPATWYSRIHRRNDWSGLIGWPATSARYGA